MAQLVFNLLDLRLDAALNHAFPSDQRATLVSVSSMAYSLLMIVASPISGSIGDISGTQQALWSLGLGLILVTAAGAAVYRFIFYKRNI